MSEPHPDECPECGSHDYYQDFSGYNQVCRDGSPRTVMQQAERNARTGGELYQKSVDEIEPAHKKAVSPWRKPGSKPPDLKKIKNIQRYIETGETS